MSVSTGTSSLQYVSALSPNIIQRDIFKGLIDIQNDDDWYAFMEGTNRQIPFVMPSREVAVAPIYRSFYNNPLKSLIDLTGATVTGSGTTSISVTGLPAGSQNILVVGDLVRTPAGQEARVQTVPSASSFTAQSVNATVLTVAAGNKLPQVSNAQEEGSSSPTPKRWDVAELSNVIQIMRKSFQFTDMEDVTAIEFNINGKPSYVLFQQIQALKDHKADISLQMLLGNLGSTLFTDASPTLSGVNGRGVQVTRGLDEYVTTYGVNDSVTTPGTMTLADLSDLESQLTAARAPMDYLVIGNRSAIAIYSDFLLNLPGTGGLTSVRLPYTGGELGLEVSVFNHGGYKYNLRAMDVFSNTSVINYVASGSTKPSVARSLYYIPMGKTPTIGGASADYMRMRYMKTQSGITNLNGAISEIWEGGLAPVPTNGDMLGKCTFTSNVGLEIFAPQKFAKQIVQ